MTCEFDFVEDPEGLEDRPRVVEVSPEGQVALVMGLQEHQVQKTNSIHLNA